MTNNVTILREQLASFSTPKGFGPIVTTTIFHSYGVGENLPGFQYPEGFWPDSDRCGSSGLKPHCLKLCVCFSTPKGFGPIVTHFLSSGAAVARRLPRQFQYPEGFWPDSDKPAMNTWTRAVWSLLRFQYPEGFWPDSDCRSCLQLNTSLCVKLTFQYPEGFWPDSDDRWDPITITNDKVFQYPEGFWPDSDGKRGSKDTNRRVAFQYPEGFWPDSDSSDVMEYIVEGCPTGWRFSTPKGFGPIVTQPN